MPKFKINTELLDKLQKQINIAVSSCSLEDLQNFWDQAKTHAIKSPEIYFMSQFTPFYFQSRKELKLEAYDQTINDDHVFTAIKRCLKNTKANFIFKD